MQGLIADSSFLATYVASCNAHTGTSKDSINLIVAYYLEAEGVGLDDASVTLLNGISCSILYVMDA